MLINENNKIFEQYTSALLSEEHDEGSPLGDYIDDMSASQLLDTLKSYDEELYNQVESVCLEIYNSSDDDEEISDPDSNEESNEDESEEGSDFNEFDSEVDDTISY